MKQNKPNKKIKISNENTNQTTLKDHEVFINFLENYKNVTNVPHIRPISFIFKEESNLGPTGKLQSALVLTFLYSLELVQPLLDDGVKIVIASDCQKEITKTVLDETNKIENLRIIYPKRTFGMNAPSSFHPKLYILKFKNVLRIVIGSGNLLNCDWNRYANVFWRKDYPMLSQCLQDEKPNHFVSYLKKFIDTCIEPFEGDLDNFLGIKFARYKIDETNVNLVCSIPTQISKSDSFNISFNQTAQIIKNNKPKINFKLDSTKIYYVTSSLGSLNFKLLYDFSKMIFQENSFNWQYAVDNKNSIINMFNVIYPSSKYINGSYFGESRANCLFLKRMIYDSFKFQKSVMRAFEGNLNVEGNNSVTPHYKIFLITHNGIIDDDTIVYIGSHNFTQSAWGKYEKDDKGMEVFNYELGVIWPSKAHSSLAKSTLVENFGVCIPPQTYSQHDHPFFVLED